MMYSIYLVAASRVLFREAYCFMDKKLFQSYLLLITLAVALVLVLTKIDVLVDGVSIKDAPDAVRSKIGFLTSELKLEDFFTPNYLFDYFATLYDVDLDVARKRKDEMFFLIPFSPTWMYIIS